MSVAEIGVTRFRFYRWYILISGAGSKRSLGPHLMQITPDFSAVRPANPQTYLIFHTNVYFFLDQKEVIENLKTILLHQKYK